MSEISIKLVTPKNIILKEKDFKMVDSKLPVNEICKHFQIKDLIWSDIDEPLVPNEKGLSNMTFAGMKSINVRGTPL